MTSTSSTLTLCSGSPGDTRAVGAVIAGRLRGGDVVALTGELGAGKTCLVQGAAAALGVAGGVRSPSFMLRRDYEGRIGVTHLDVYRLETLAEVGVLGHDDPAQRERVTFIEWGDAIRPLLPADHLEVELRLPPAEDLRPADGMPEDEPRTLVLRAHGRGWRQRLAELTDDCGAWVRP